MEPKGNQSSEEVLKEVNFEKGIFEYKDWDEEECTLKVDAVPDKETAVSIADIIFKSMQKEGRFKNYTMQRIFYDEEDEIWIVSFWEDKGIDYDVPDCNIAFRKSDAKVLRVWVGE